MAPPREAWLGRAELYVAMTSSNWLAADHIPRHVAGLQLTPRPGTFSRYPQHTHTHSLSLSLPRCSLTSWPRQAYITTVTATQSHLVEG